MRRDEFKRSRMASQESSDLEELERVVLGLPSPSNSQGSTEHQQVDETMQLDVVNVGVAEDEDDEILVVQSNIFKYHGDETSSLDQQVSQGILKFEYRDEDDDDDIIEIDVVEKKKQNDSLITIDDGESNFEIHEEDIDVTDKDKGQTCDECGLLFSASKLEDHKFEKHQVKNRNIKRFENGNFFMLAD